MHVWNGLESLTTPFAASSVAIGMFDGVHIGHQALIRAAVADARAHARPALVFTFDRHPAELIAPERAPGYLTTPEQRREYIGALGPDHLVIARFDESLRSMPPEDFLRDILKGRLGARAVMVGQDFRFGRAQAGDVALLRASQERCGYALSVLKPVLTDGEKVGSTRIRQRVAAGDVAGAHAALGRPYTLVGTVVEGEKLGRRLGYPTANMTLTARQIVPADGVYAAWATWRGGRRMGACSIGTRPTVGGRHLVIETYLLDFAGDLYGETLSVEFLARLRGQETFGSVEALIAQMDRDVAEVRRLLAETEG